MWNLVFVLLTLISFGEPQCIEASRLLVGKTKEFQDPSTQKNIHREVTIGHSKLLGHDTTNEATTEVTLPAPPAQGMSQPPPPGHKVDDFRPTDPGHSPGVGHSFGN